MKSYKIGDVVKGIVTGIEDYGIFVSFDDETTGLIHISEISDSFVKKVSDYANIGDKIEAKVIDYSEGDNHLKLSIKAMGNSAYLNNKQRGIVETKTGFNNLQNELSYWIEKKAKEMSKK